VAQSRRDYIKAGQYYTSDYLRMSGLDNSRSFDTMFKLIASTDKSASDDGVISASTMYGETDTSQVYQVQIKNPDIKVFSAEYTSSQSGTELLPAPADNERYVITYGSIRADTNAGDAYISDESGTTILQCYLDRFQSVVAEELHSPMGQGEAISLTSTQGDDELFVCLNYYIETVEAD